MKKRIGWLVLVLLTIAIAIMFYSTKLFHPKNINRIVVELDGVQKEADNTQISGILKDFSNSIKFPDSGSEPWSCGVDEDRYCVYLYYNNDLLYRFAPVMDGCSSFECCYNAYGHDDFFISCEKAKRIVDLITENPYLMSRYD